MTLTHAADSSANDERPTGVHGPILLTEAELDRVAAAGSKPGGTGDGVAASRYCPRP